jgi:hypothetical protein
VWNRIPPYLVLLLAAFIFGSGLFLGLGSRFVVLRKEKCAPEREFILRILPAEPLLGIFGKDESSRPEVGRLFFGVEARLRGLRGARGVILPKHCELQNRSTSRSLYLL